MTGTMNTGKNKPMGMASTGSDPMSTMDGGGASSDWGDTSYERDTPGTRPYNAGDMKSTKAGSKGRSQDMETRGVKRSEVQQREKELTAA